ncbi:MAG TPA: MobF family relaxase [Actinomycetota bacterium]|jgi:DNA primase catalytic core|nr:MobF family relaxase [Actinomycetota bacterium]
MTVHKLTAGSGYDYLTRQVAAQDATERGHSGLASYYSAKGEAPGVWVGSGMANLEGLDAGDPVTEEQMRNLFGSGRHPLAERLREAAAEQGADPSGQERATWLGTPYKVYSDVSEFRRRVAQRVAIVNVQRGLSADAPGSVEDRARIRTQVAVELFREEFNRDPADARELAAAIARHSRPATTAVAGFDLTFSPVKSVSALWAVADRPVAAAIERAHQLAVQDALTYLENNALFTREGANGIRQVETQGLIATAFTHRDSRAGDPDLHTHVAVANKVRAKGSGKWLAIDGRLIYKANVAASETYNTRLEHHLRRALGVRFEARPNPDARKRPVREIVGVDPELNARWSSRRATIEVRRRLLAKAFQASHGRPPSPIESIQLAQQATLETREAKHEPRSLDEQRATWSRQAKDVLGGARQVQAMIAATLAPQRRPGPRVDNAWIHTTAASIQATLQTRRSHWQRWHVEAEALRQVRHVDLATPDIDRVVALVVDEVLTRHSVPLTRAEDPVEVPESLRRSDGSSVYTIASSARFTSSEILAAEARIVERAGQFDGRRVPANAVDLAMLASTANGLPLNAGQATLVREMATSGARLQLAIAPAGAGKTTAMSALTHAWSEGGGTVVGLAPSAAAADVLGENIHATTDTIAKLTWHLDHPAMGDLPEWAAAIGPATLVVIDEAGMADTLSLDKVIDFVVTRGGFVRLIGDDQQLASVGAGGVLRDIQATHGSLHLTELMRFSDPAEGAASLALRDGRPEALGFYLDRDRVHVGDLATMTDTVFTAWRASHAAGTDAIMLAPTRDLVAELNHRARQYRLEDQGSAPTRTVTLADGNLASVGDTVITRSNDRTLRIAATDWVKNGDRWTVTAVSHNGTISVQHAKNGRFVDLPAGYVAASVELGYACTIHTAQGVTADTSHTLLSGSEPRQLAYTALTRGRSANHLYLEVVGDGDEHNVIRPDHTHPATATDILERILARDDSPRSATTTARDANDPALQLFDEVNRYVDSLYVAAEAQLGPAHVARLDANVDTIVPDLTHAEAWPTLRAHLLLLSAHGLDPLLELRAAAGMREIDTAADVASVIDWRLDDSGLRSAGTGPLPWLPGVPEDLTDDPEWGPYLASRAALVRDLAGQVRDRASTSTDLPEWARQGQGRPTPELLADVAVWRAANGVDPTDRRPTGPTQISKAHYVWQSGLKTRLAGNRTPALAEWRETLDRVLAYPQRDPFTPLLAERLSALSRAGIDAPSMVRRALSEGPLPDDHNAAALWWRITAHLSPAVAAQAAGDHQLRTDWADRLPHLLGTDRAAHVRESSWWPTLVTVVDHAVARGGRVEELLGNPPDGEDLDLCQALVWRISVLNDPPPTEHERASWPDLDEGAEDEPNPFWDEDDSLIWAPTQREWDALEPVGGHEAPEPTTDDDPFAAGDLDDEDPEADEHAYGYLSWAARLREFAQPLPPADREISVQLDRAYDADTAPVSPARILELNQIALAYFADRFPGSWAQGYLHERLGVDLTGDRHVQPGYAPAGWTGLVSHLRRHGASDLELTESGLATTTRQGRIIDRFRDRLVFPITTTAASGELQTLGFVGRRHPQLADKDAGPKYLNTPETALFHKGAQLHIVRHDLLTAGATPVLVEGPMDALAVSVAGQGRFVGVAPLGTALTEEQAAQLARLSHDHQRPPVIATDADLAGQVAAQRDYWLLTQHALHPQTVPLRPGSDPADLLALSGPDALYRLLQEQTPLSDTLLSERLTHLEGMSAARSAVTVLAAGDPASWEGGVEQVSQRTGVPVPRVRRELADVVRRWDQDPRDVVAEQVNDLSSVRARLGTSSHAVSLASAKPTPRPQPDLAPSLGPAPSRRR